MNKGLIPARASWKKTAGFSLLITVNVLLATWFSALLDTHFLPDLHGALGSFGSTWGDLPWHMSIIMGFVERGYGGLLEDPVYSGVKLVYPFLPEIVPGLLVKAGLSLRSSLIITTWPFLVLVTSLISALAYRMTRSAYAAALAPLFFCLSGSVVGTWYFLQDTMASGQGLFSALWNVGQSYANVFGRDLYFTNIVSDFLLPQRTIVFGLVVGLVALLFLWSYWSEGNRRSLSWAAVFIGILPLFHTHSFVALCIISGTLGVVDLTQNFIRKTARSSQLSVLKLWTFHFGILAILALPQLLLILPENQTSFLQWQIGWLAKDGNWFAFWLKNLGAYFFLIPLAFVFTMWDERRNPSRLLTKDYRLPTTSRPYPISTFFLGFLAVFVGANLLIFQPWDWDNMKLFVWWFLGSIILVLHATIELLRWISSKRPMIRIPVYCLLFTIFCSLVSTGLLAARYESGKSLPLLSEADRELGAFVREHTPVDALFLTSQRHNHPVPTLAGRRIYLGYGGWLWSHGIDASGRSEKVKAMLAGNDAMLHAEGIRYVVLERDMTNADTNFFDRYGTKLFSNRDFTLYEIP